MKASGYYLKESVTLKGLTQERKNNMKYIDADKLIKSVNNYKEGAKAALNPIDGDADYYKGKIDACKDIQEFITGLQKLPSPQPNWKPSKEQMKALNAVANEGVLLDLFNDLLKLF